MPLTPRSKAINPPPPEKPKDAFLKFVEQRSGLVYAMQSAAALELLRREWKKEKR